MSLGKLPYSPMSWNGPSGCPIPQHSRKKSLNDPPWELTALGADSSRSCPENQSRDKQAVLTRAAGSQFWILLHPYPHIISVLQNLPLKAFACKCLCLLSEHQKPS